jgi:hypothetical protein
MSFLQNISARIATVSRIMNQLRGQTLLSHSPPFTGTLSALYAEISIPECNKELSTYQAYTSSIGIDLLAVKPATVLARFL